MNTQTQSLNVNRKAQRLLRNAFLHLNPCDAEAAMILSRAMDRVDNERRRLKHAASMRRGRLCLIVEGVR